MRGLFFNAQPTADTTKYPSGYDREYDSDDFNRYMGVFFTNGIFVREDADACKVVVTWGAKPPTHGISIKPGIVLVDGGQCHIESTDRVIVKPNPIGTAYTSIMCRRNNSADVRGFELIAVSSIDDYPAPVRDGDVYDMCLAHLDVEVDGIISWMEDTRGNQDVCGFAALTGQPPYYPPDEANLPYILWLYVLGLPMTEEQKAAVESNPSLMAIFNQSRIVQAIQMATKEEAEAGVDNSKFMTPKRVKEAIEASYEVGDISMGLSSPDLPGWMPCNGGVLDFSYYPKLDAVAGAKFRAPLSRKASGVATQANQPWGRVTRTTDSHLIYFARVGSSIFYCYAYNMATGTNTLINTATTISADGYSALIPVIGSNHTVLVQFAANTGAGFLKIIGPTGSAGPDIAISAPDNMQNTPANRYAAVLKDSNTIYLYCTGNKNGELIRYALTISSNSVSTSVLTGGTFGYQGLLWINNAYIYLNPYGTSNLLRAPIGFASLTEFVAIGGPTNYRTFPDDKGNILYAGYATSYLIKADGTQHSINGIFESSAELSYVSSWFYWNEDKGYGVVYVSQGTPYLICFTLSGRVDKYTLAASEVVCFSGMFGTHSAGTSPYSLSLWYIYRDIRLPSLVDGNGKTYASIRVK